MQLFPQSSNLSARKFPAPTAFSSLRPSTTTPLPSKNITLGRTCRLHVTTAPLKNALDWASRPPNVWAGKAAEIVSAGGGFGGGLAQYHLREVGVFVDLQFVNKPEFFLEAFQRPYLFDGDELIDADTRNKLEEVLLSLQDLTLRLNADPAQVT